MRRVAFVYCAKGWIRKVACVIAGLRWAARRNWPFTRSASAREVEGARGCEALDRVLPSCLWS